MTASIALSRIHFPVTTLGPGRRIGIWFQGCSIRYPGCISMDTWAPGRGITTIDEIVNAVAQWLPVADGITISGGEPFDQPIALLDLLRSLRSLTGRARIYGSSVDQGQGNGGCFPSSFPPLNDRPLAILGLAGT